MSNTLLEKHRKPVHRDFGPSLELNVSPWRIDLVRALLNEDSKPEWTHSGMAYIIAEQMGVNDLEEFVYCLNEEIKRRQ